MSDKTNIEWTDRTWNPLAAFLKHDVFVPTKNSGKKLIPADTRGWFCTKCSPGCAHCYAEKINLRLGNGLEYAVRNLDEIEFRLVNLKQPLGWKKPQRVFVNSMTDLFHEAVPFELIDQVFAVMALAGGVTFQVLTKRATRMREYMQRLAKSIEPLEKCAREIGYTFKFEHEGEKHSLLRWPIPNVWLGVSVENQAAADARVHELLATPAAVKFLSVEPMLGEVDLLIKGECSSWTCPDCNSKNVETDLCDPSEGKWWKCLDCGISDWVEPLWNSDIHWVICGGESGTKARPMHPDWALSLRDQCVDAGVPFLFKQWGNWKPICEGGEDWVNALYVSNRKAESHEDQGAIDESYGRRCTVNHEVLHFNGSRQDVLTEGAFLQGTSAMTVFNVGKRAAGRLLDGREWNQFPGSARDSRAGLRDSRGPEKIGVGGGAPPTARESRALPGEHHHGSH